ncbi:MAG: ATP-binding protein [Paludibacteraceae bacterium]|nr:ATP-binding protein [Paludibacteraceae bacterium]
MQRYLIGQLALWKDKPDRKPLILNGARQVGKTWILHEFGKTYFKNTVYVYCDDKKEDLVHIFDNLSPSHIVQALETYTNSRIVAGETLIVLDEVQEIPRALTCLKYFCEQAPEYHIAVAGSLLGLMLHEGTSFPVGKVDMMQLYPFTFIEFLLALGKEQLVDALQAENEPILSALHPTLIELLKQYFFIGGMPEAISKYVETQSYISVRRVQEAILKSYLSDFSKHAPKEQIERISMVYRSIPAQLSKENKKFTYGVVKEGARAKDFEIAVQWLIDAGLVLPVSRVTKPQMPLKFYEDFIAYKLYLSDVGLLGAMNGVSPRAMLLSDKVFTEYKGAFVENYVLQSLQGLDLPIFYYSKPQSTQEVDFLVQFDDMIIPIEAKSGTNLRSQSLNAYRKEQSPQLAIKTSLLPFKQNEGLINMPIYRVRTWFENQIKKSQAELEELNINNL